MSSRLCWIGCWLLIDYFEAEGVKLYCGDALDIIPTLPIVGKGGAGKRVCDLFLTDPPYCNGYQSNSRDVLGKFDAIAGDDDAQKVLEILRLSWRALKINRHGYVFGPITPATVVPNEVGGTTTLIWDKSSMSGGDISSPWGQSHEDIWFGVKRYTGKRSAQTGRTAARMRQGSVLRASRTGETKRAHPTQKPVPLIMQLVEMSSNRGEIVLDPFMGVGSTCVAALLTGRRTIGIELEQQYFHKAVADIKRALVVAEQIRSFR